MEVVKLDQKVMPLAGHLQELRKLFIVFGLALTISSMVIFAAFGDSLFLLFTDPVKKLGVPIIAIRVTELFITKIKLSLLGGFVAAFPLLVWQVWGFILPALNKKEKRMVYALAPASVILFVLGIIFAYFTVFPLAVRFLLLTVSGELSPMITIREYVSFTLSFFIPFGLAFQLPVAVYVLGKLNLVHPSLLKKKRKYALLLIVFAAAVLTPGPDIISQLMMALPMYLLYEISILISYLVTRKSVRKPGARTVEA